MLITLSRRTVICQSVLEVWLTGVAPLGAVSYRFKLNISLVSPNFLLFYHDLLKPSFRLAYGMQAYIIFTYCSSIC